jgi:hypothetical protein
LSSWLYCPGALVARSLTRALTPRHTYISFAHILTRSHTHHTTSHHTTPRAQSSLETTIGTNSPSVCRRLSALCGDGGGGKRIPALYLILYISLALPSPLTVGLGGQTVPGILCSIACQHHSRRRLVLLSSRCSPAKRDQSLTFLPRYISALSTSQLNPGLSYLSCFTLFTSAIVVSPSGSPFIWSLAILRINERFCHLRCSPVPSPSFPVVASSRLLERKHFGLPQLPTL